MSARIRIRLACLSFQVVKRYKSSHLLHQPHTIAVRIDNAKRRKDAENWINYRNAIMNHDYYYGNQHIVFFFYSFVPYNANTLEGKVFPGLIWRQLVKKKCSTYVIVYTYALTFGVHEKRIDLPVSMQAYQRTKGAIENCLTVKIRKSWSKYRVMSPEGNQRQKTGAWF